MTASGSRRGFLLLAGSCAVLLAGCSDALPRDSQGALRRATGGTLYVGASENAPWTEFDSPGSVSGTEADLIEGYAARIGASIHWETAAMGDLATMMTDNELDLIIGGLTADTPWSDKISPTRPYQESRGVDGSTEKMVIGVRPGENALQVSLERFLAEEKGEL
ncbi:MAG: transporter substrate-binding domain-containing protein [Brachybacterium tyrofermentans]